MFMDHLLIKNILWQSISSPSLEYFSLVKKGDYFSLSGNMALLLADVPAKASYQVHCSKNWETRNANICFSTKDHQQSLIVEKDSNNTWLINHSENTAFKECIDIDIGITPSTNMLPIQRLKLWPGQSQVITAIWVRFPELTIQPARQQYTCMDKHSYLYESLSSSFKATIKIDDLGIPIDYEYGWKRLGEYP